MLARIARHFSNSLKTVLADLNKLRNVVDNDVVEKTVYNKLVTKVNSIDTNRFF